jgi:hypothetical protein
MAMLDRRFFSFLFLALVFFSPLVQTRLGTVVAWFILFYFCLQLPDENHDLRDLFR